MAMIAIQTTTRPGVAAPRANSLDALDTAPLPNESGTGPATRMLYLDLVLDGATVRTLVRVQARDNTLWIAPADLIAAGLALPPAMAADMAAPMDLSTIPGLDYDFDSARQQLTLYPANDLRPLQRLGPQPAATVRANRGSGLVLDWDAYGEAFGTRRNASVALASRWFGRFGTVMYTGVNHAGNGSENGFHRLDSHWRLSDPDRMWTWHAGDYVSSGFDWTRPVRMAGLQWRRDFGVRPDLVTQPIPRLEGDATLPSSVELFVDGVRQFDADIAPGPFVLSQAPRVVGAGRAVVVVTDALGRRTETNVPLYVDHQRLARGLTDFSLEVGALRRGYGTAQDRYDPGISASGSWRHGFRDDLTVEGHGEMGPGLSNGGIGLAWAPGGRAGLVTAAVSRSTGDSAGHQRALGYQWLGPALGVDLKSQRTSAGYRDLGSMEGGMAPLRAQDRALLWAKVPGGTVSLTWLRFRTHDVPAGRILGIGVTHSVGRATFTANVFRNDKARSGLAMTLSLPLGDGRHAAAALDGRDGRDSASIAVRRTPAYEGGWGWDARISHDGSGQLGAARRGEHGEGAFGIERRGTATGGFAEGNGSLVLMGGQIFASRRIHDAFAVVSTAGLPDVPVLFENRVVGHTDASGHLLLADLRGWQQNRIGIDPDALPADISVPLVERLVTPADRSGVSVPFPVTRTRRVVVRLRQADGSPVAAGTRVQRVDGSHAIVGFDGELWLEPSDVDQHVHWTQAGRGCTALVRQQGTPTGPVLAECRPLEASR